jgi:NAD(P)-dependent dehydrogenase (short-subunit alcohol dehydrogenase family)
MDPRCVRRSSRARVYFEKLRLARVAVVTARGQAVGLVCVMAMAEAGARLVIADVDREIAESSQRAMSDLSYKVEVEILDVGDSRCQ